MVVRKDRNMSPRWCPSAKTLDYVWDVFLQICHAYGVEVNREPRQTRENFLTRITRITRIAANWFHAR